MKVSPQGRPLPGILTGHHEPIFDVLPGNVLQNLHRNSSENALLWNKVYPLARSGLRLVDMLKLTPIWGTAELPVDDDELEAYFWGYRADGKRMAALGRTLQAVDGPGPRTEVDLFLVGSQNLIVVEVKRGSALGRCSRYNNLSCPAVHELGPTAEPCRYWNERRARFDRHLIIEEPVTGTRPTCDRHYQLARTLMVGGDIAEQLDRRLHLWLITPRRHWRRLERTWLDFAGRVKDPTLWRRLRVLAWEELDQLRPKHSSENSSSEMEQ